MHELNPLMLRSKPLEVNSEESLIFLSSYLDYLNYAHSNRLLGLTPFLYVKVNGYIEGMRSSPSDRNHTIPLYTTERKAMITRKLKFQ